MIRSRRLQGGDTLPPAGATVHPRGSSPVLVVLNEPGKENSRSKALYSKQQGIQWIQRSDSAEGGAKRARRRLECLRDKLVEGLALDVGNLELERRRLPRTVTTGEGAGTQGEPP